MAIRGVIFDLDGTLYAMKPHFKPLLTFFCAPNFLRVPKFMKSRGKFRGVEMESGEKLFSALTSDFELELKIKNSDIWIEKNFYPAFIKTLKFLRNRPQINSLLKELKSKNIKIAVLSDFGKVEERLNSLKIDSSLFDITASTEEMGAFKPAPRPFLEICKELNLPPREVLLVGDRDDTDKAGAKAAGLQFFKVDGKDNNNWLSSLKTLRELVGLSLL